MKIFIDQAVTGEDINLLKEEMNKIIPTLKDLGYEVYCGFMEGKDPNLNRAFIEIENSDVFLAIIRSDKKSEGMLVEIGYCVAKNKKLILAISKNVNTKLKEISDQIIKYENIDELNEKLKNLK